MVRLAFVINLDFNGTPMTQSGAIAALPSIQSLPIPENRDEL
jgi:hypothetical protein